MIAITARLDADLEALSASQAPFAASRALNATALGARDEVRGNLPKRFTLRNGWTRGGIQARMSTKTSLVAQVVAPVYMDVQETGGRRRPEAGRAISVPGETLDGPRVIPKRNRPRALIASGSAFVIPFDGGNAGLYRRKGKRIELLYTFTDQADYTDRFRFESDVSKHAAREFGGHFALALAEATRKG